ncbi:hypothetical protein E4U55_008191 [Claviceps digitariae]|nr:hypothetical protein E4U55_008191 [Claviceps digitariae]
MPSQTIAFAIEQHKILHSLRPTLRILQQQQPEEPPHLGDLSPVTSPQSHLQPNMHSTALLTILAAGASVAAASDHVVLTVKKVQTMTVTHCADSYTDCPLHKTSAAATTPADSSSSAVETSVAPTTQTTVSAAPTGTAPASSTTGSVLLPTGAASGLRAQTGAAAVAVAAVIAMVY